MLIVLYSLLKSVGRKGRSKLPEDDLPAIREIFDAKTAVLFKQRRIDHRHDDPTNIPYIVISVICAVEPVAEAGGYHHHSVSRVRIRPAMDKFQS